MDIKNYSDTNKIYNVDKKELKMLKGDMLNNKDVVHCGKYYIHIIRNKYKCASMETYVNTEEDLRDLSISKQPYYIRDFVDGLDQEDIS